MLFKRSTKPGSKWWVRFAVKGIEVRQSSGTDSKELAEAFEQNLREAIWREQNLGEETHTWEEACKRWLKEKAKKRSLKRDVLAITSIGIDGATPLDEVGSGAAVSKTSAPRDLAVLRGILRRAVKPWRWLDQTPHIEVPAQEKHDPRWIKPEQFVTLIKELPPHAQQIAKFGVATGMRSRNIRELKWEGINGKTVYVSSLSAKANKAIGIPLSKEAMAILKEQAGAHPVYVFTDHVGRAPVGSLKTCWGKATKRAGIEGFRFHDLRHTWAAWHALQGTPPLLLKQLGGWSSLAMVEKYGAINPGHLADWADNSAYKKRHTSKSVKKRTPIKH